MPNFVFQKEIILSRQARDKRGENPLKRSTLLFQACTVSTSVTPAAWWNPQQPGESAGSIPSCGKRHFLSHFCRRNEIILPRQARDKHEEKFRKEMRFL
jgi:hypothetical protein